MLILTGAIVYFATGQESWTALLPSIAGIPVTIVGMIAVNPERRKIGLYLAAGLIAILALGTLRGVAAFLTGDLTTASIINSVLFVLSIGYLGVLVYRLRISRGARDLS